MACSICSGTPVYARGWCRKHYDRWLKWGDPEHPDQRATKGGRFHDSRGYIKVSKTFLPEEDRGLCDASWGVYEHRLLMARHLGRPLLPEESVHHKNGKRDDNRLENLELWSRYHPRGQRVEDLIAHAHHVLEIYRDYTPLSPAT